MAHIDNNNILSAMRGRVGNLVFRRVGDKTIVSQRPVRKNETQSPRQIANRAKFAAASRYAKEALKNPHILKRYEVIAREAELSNAYTAALRDFLRPLQITGISVESTTPKCFTRSLVSRVTGLEKVHLTIRIHVTDPHTVQNIDVQLLKQKGDVVEKGVAVYDEEEGAFMFHVVAALCKIRGGSVTAEATGISGATHWYEHRIAHQSFSDGGNLSKSAHRLD